MPVHDELGKRMKENYENRAKSYLMRRTPVAIRIDGRAFHTFTKGFHKPFDDVLIASMQETMLYLCKNIQGCVFGYTQSDEITLILVDYAKLESDAWFDYNIQKLCSIAASMATMKFNQFFSVKIDPFNFEEPKDMNDDESWAYYNSLKKSINKGAIFDARCFNVPKEEVANLIYWRQIDAIRNSIQMVAQANFNQKELQGLSCNQLKEKLLNEKNIDWNGLDIFKQRGTTAYQHKDLGWRLDYYMPIIKDCRNYIEKWIYTGEE